MTHLISNLCPIFVKKLATYIVVVEKFFLLIFGNLSTWETANLAIKCNATGRDMPLPLKYSLLKIKVALYNFIEINILSILNKYNPLNHGVQKIEKIDSPFFCAKKYFLSLFKKDEKH